MPRDGSVVTPSERRKSQTVPAVANKDTSPMSSAKRRKSSLRQARSGPDKHKATAAALKSVKFEVVPSIRPCREFFSQLELLRDERLGQMGKLFESIGPTLVKLESLILGTFTGSASKMKHYYTFWERELFTLLVRWVTTNLDRFGQALCRDEPLFQVDATLSPPEILLRPNTHEVFNIVVHSVKDFLERLRGFRRWMDGTCVLCEPLISADEHYMFTFFEDVLQIPQIGDLMAHLQNVANKLMGEVNAYVVRWRNYQSLWLYDKAMICDRFLGRNVALVRLDEKFLFYTQLVDDLRQSRTHQDVRGIRVNLVPLLDSICAHAAEWSATLGRLLNERTYHSLIAMKEHIHQLRLDLDRNIRGLGDFKTVMATIATVQTTTLTVEMRLKDMQETYSVLEDHGIDFAYTDMMMAYHLERRWRKLYNSSMNRGVSLAPIKKKFADMTCVEIETFKTDVAGFVTAFEAEGPGAVGHDMDRGIKLMDLYVTRFEEMDGQREELVKAEKLFDMPMTDYGEFLRVKRDFEGMHVLYKLYKQQKIARENWSRTLWAHLNPMALTDGMENFMKEYRKIPKWVSTSL